MLGLADSVIETFHDSETDQCGSTKVHIDSPLRAFEDQNNVIHLTVSDPGARGWQWTGSVASFTNRPSTAKLDCTSVMAGSTGNNDIPSFDQKTWIQALYFAAPTVYAYGHEDYFGTRTAEPGCHDAGTSDGKPYCWYAAVGTWQATAPASGTHLSFGKTATAPDHVAVYPHVRYPGHANTPKAGWIGYGTPSELRIRRAAHRRLPVPQRGSDPSGQLAGVERKHDRPCVRSTDAQSVRGREPPLRGGQSGSLSILRAQHPVAQTVRALHRDIPGKRRRQVRHLAEPAELECAPDAAGLHDGCGELPRGHRLRRWRLG